ncbi:unnamed protein product [Auanema sp. JU1783]|nr:unnamed protein product [Auanema sp. JU1783]
MSSLVILTAVQPGKDNEDMVPSFSGQKKKIGVHECWISTDMRGDLLTCTLHIKNHSNNNVISCIRGLDIVQDLDRMRSREFEDKIELQPYVDTQVVLFYERTVSNYCPVCVVLNIFDQTPRSAKCFDFVSPSFSNSNVCLVVGQTRIYAHREFLAFCSPVFGAMFSCYFVEGKEDEVKLNNIDPEYFLIFLNILYHNCRKVNEESYIHLLDLADQFDTACVKLLCEDYLIMNISTCSDYLSVLRLCHSYRLQRLMSRIQSNKIRNLNILDNKEQKLLTQLMDHNLKFIDKKKLRAYNVKYPLMSEYLLDLSQPPPNDDAVLFMINGFKIYGNKQVLSIFSPTLRSMVESAKNKRIGIEGVSYQEFYHLISLLSHSVKDSQRLNEYTVLPMFKLAEKYKVQVLQEECRLFLLSYDGYFLKYKDVLVLADEKNFEDVRERIYGRIAEVASAVKSLTTTNCFDSMPVCSFAVEESYSFLRRWCS